MAFAVAVVGVYAAEFAAFFGRVGRMDHDQFLVFYELQYWNVRLFGLSRQWCPLLCGGLSIAADPQVPFLSAGMWLSTLVGPFYGLRLATIGWLALGWTGAFAYAGLWRRDARVRSLAASLFVGNGFFVMRLRHGHLDLVPMLSLPLVLWLLHRREDLGRRLGGGAAGTMLVALPLAALVALAVDGAPVMIIHWLAWIGVYAVTLAIVERRAGAPALLGCAVAVAAVLDAGYLWPVLAAQEEFPRATADAFTNPLSLLWFLVVPGGGKVVPAPALGHELTVWVGPVLLYAILRHGRAFVRQLPTALRVPLAVTAAVSIVLGMGSLAAAGWPRLLSPFDLLRPLPGFRSIGVTGRYWGFLTLPLALAGAGGVAALLSARPPRRLARTAVAVALLMQVAFQAWALASALAGSRPYRAPELAFLEPLDYERRGHDLQGAVITPTRGVIDCYDNGDFDRPAMEPGHELVREVWRDGEPFHPSAFSAHFLGWSRIVVGPARTLPPGRWRVVLNQAHHRFWRAAGPAVVTETSTGNLTLDWDGTAVPLPVSLAFADRVSAVGARVSRTAWAVLFLVLALVGWRGRRQARVPRAGGAP